MNNTTKKVKRGGMWRRGKFISRQTGKPVGRAGLTARHQVASEHEFANKHVNSALNELSNNENHNTFNSTELIDTQHISNTYFYITKNNGVLVLNTLSKHQLTSLHDAKIHSKSNKYIHFISPDKYYVIIRLKSKNGKEEKYYYLIQSYQYVNPILDVPIE